MNIQRSDFYPDQLYTGRSFKLDSTLRLLYKQQAMLTVFPSGVISIDGLSRYTVDGNPIEEFAFSYVNGRGKLIYDSVEKCLYFTTQLAQTSIRAGDDPEIVSQEQLSFKENGLTFIYDDYSGLIEIQVPVPEKTVAERRLLRVYYRDTVEDAEFLFGVIRGGLDVVDYFVGVVIDLTQLEAV